MAIHALRTTIGRDIKRGQAINRWFAAMQLADDVVPFDGDARGEARSGRPGGLRLVDSLAQRVPHPCNARVGDGWTQIECLVRPPPFACAEGWGTHAIVFRRIRRHDSSPGALGQP